MNNPDILKELVKELFDKYLDVEEESDGGNMFHPIKVSCCRAMEMEPLNNLLKEMKELSHS